MAAGLKKFCFRRLAQAVNWTHIHLMFTHIPVIGVGVVIAFLIVGRIRGSREIELVALQMFVALALLSIVVYLTGSPASHHMREMPGISQDAIHRYSFSGCACEVPRHGCNARSVYECIAGAGFRGIFADALDGQFRRKNPPSRN
jgi:hypothetical protein